MKTLNYHQTLEIVENFMIKSGIRSFCTDICKGGCCAYCYEKPTACRHHEGRRLACSTYICNFPNRNMDSMLRRAGENVQKCIGDIIKKHTKEYRADIFFSVPHPTVFTKFRIDSELVNPCYIGAINTTKRIVDKVIECRNKVLESPKGKEHPKQADRFRAFYLEGREITHFLL